MRKLIYRLTGTDRAFIIANYGQNLAQFFALAAEAQKDFPHLKPEDIDVGRVTQSTYMKGFALVSFLLPENSEHPDYSVLTDRMDFSW